MSGLLSQGWEVWHDSGVRIRFVGIVAVLAVLAAACDGGGNRPKPSDASTPVATAASTTPSAPRTGPLTTGPGVQPGDKPPVLPDAAKQHTSTGALLFADYYFKAFDWSVATNDPYLVESISGPSCSACQRVIKGLRSFANEGAILRGGRIHVQSAKIVTGTFRVQSEYVVEISLNQDPEVVSHPSSAPSRVAPVTNDISLVFVSWVGQQWQINEVGAPS
jgi:hypothetical protein